MGIFTDLVKNLKNSTPTTNSKGSTFSNIVNTINATSKTSNSTTKNTNTNNKNDKNNKNNKGGGGNNKPSNNNAAASVPNVPVADSDIITWSGAENIRFYVKPSVIQGIKELSIKASVNSEEKENGGNKLPTKKTAGAIEVTIKAELNAHIGADVQGMSMAIIDAARDGKTGYLYCYGKKLFPAAFMMMEAETSDIQMNGRGQWVKCIVTMKMKQSTKIDGASAAELSGGGRGGGTKKLIAGLAATIAGKNKAGSAETRAKDSIKSTISATNDAKKTSQDLLKQATTVKPPLVPSGQSQSSE